MKKVFLLVAGFLLLDSGIVAQALSQRLQKAFAAFEKDEQLKHAISSLYVIDARTGQVVFDKNSQVGLAPASTQKIITSATAFELLGKDYRYKTELGYSGNIKNGILDGDLIITGSFDPTFGSWRYSQTKEDIIISNWKYSFWKSGIKKFKNVYYSEEPGLGMRSIPDGWIWQDIGNYYGAGSRPLNWKENQFDLVLESKKDTGLITIVRESEERHLRFFNNVISARKGSGDNAYIYLTPSSTHGFLKGTIPIGEKSFKISGSMPSPPLTFLHAFLDSILINLELNDVQYKADDIEDYAPRTLSSRLTNLIIHYSPSLDSIIYWFNKKSINLYGEALIKTFAYEKQGFGSTDSGVAIVKKFWKDKGLDDDELNIYDGSGLSPLNRVTTHAQVEILKYAKTKDWYPYFLKSLPEYNGMTMKSGTISDVKGFCGYHKAKDGKDYIFSFLVNNYSGKSSQLVGKMYKVLDELK